MQLLFSFFEGKGDGFYREWVVLVGLKKKEYALFTQRWCGLILETHSPSFFFHNCKDLGEKLW